MNKFLTLCSVLLLGVVGCEKDGGNEPASARKVKSITSYSTTDNTGFQRIMLFEYDAQGRMVALKSYQDAERKKPSISVLVDYSKVSAGTITFTNSNAYGSSTSVANFVASLDAQGRVTSIVETVPGRPESTSTETLTYNADNYLIGDDQFGNISSLAWTNGNMTQFKSDKGSREVNLTYEDKPLGSMNLDLNWILYSGGEWLAFLAGGNGSFSPLRVQGYCGKSNARMVKTCDNIIPSNWGMSNLSFVCEYKYDQFNCPIEIIRKGVHSTGMGGTSYARLVISYE